MILPLLITTAFIDSLNPCAISVLLLTVGCLISIGRDRSNILKVGSAYIFAIFLVYVGIGLGTLQALQMFNMPHIMAKVGAGILIAVGAINIINEYFPRFPIKLKIPKAAHERIAGLMEKASVSTAFVLGAVVGLYEFPCTGGPYLMILGLLHDQSTRWEGLGYLLFYNLIFVLPLFVILLIASNPVLTDKVRSWKKSETPIWRLWGGVAMIVLGGIIFFIT
jgi:cytochrome c biogenesis protein CcdA